MTWDAYNRRKQALREMLAIADRQRDVSLATLLDTIDPERKAFATETELLFELQMTWFQRLSGQLDRLASEGVEPPEIVAVQAWVSCAGDLPAVRALLDAHRDEPALQKAIAKEFALLATSAGVPAYHPELTRQGQRIQDSARRAAAEAPQLLEMNRSRACSATRRGSRPGLMARLRSVIAA